jgi:hypothetical protein
MVDPPLKVHRGEQGDDHGIKNGHRPILGCPSGGGEEQAASEGTRSVSCAGQSNRVLTACGRTANQRGAEHAA